MGRCCAWGAVRPSGRLLPWLPTWRSRACPPRAQCHPEPLVALGAGAICLKKREPSDALLGDGCVVVGRGNHGWEVGDYGGSGQGPCHKLQGLKTRAT